MGVIVLLLLESHPPPVTVTVLCYTVSNIPLGAGNQCKLEYMNVYQSIVALLFPFLDGADIDGE